MDGGEPKEYHLKRPLLRKTHIGKTSFPFGLLQQHLGSAKMVYRFIQAFLHNHAEPADRTTY